MPTASLGTGLASCLLLAFAAGIAQAREAKPPVAPPPPTVVPSPSTVAPSPPTVQTITVINGPNVTHHYVVQGGSPHLQARYLEAGLAEDQVVLAQSLSQLKLDYAQNERIADRLRLAQLSAGSPAPYPYYAPVRYAYGDCPDYSRGDLLIKSSIAPQLGPAATYEDGVKAIRTWENAQVEAEKTLEAERSGASPAPVKKPAAPGPDKKPAAPGPVKKPAAPGQTQSDPPPQDQNSPSLARNSNPDNRRVILSALMTIPGYHGMEATSPAFSAASTPPPAEEGLPLGVEQGLSHLDSLGIALGFCLGAPLLAIKLWLGGTS